MNKRELEPFRIKLEAERSELESELAEVSKRNPANPNEWDAASGNMDVDSADENEVADKMEELEENRGITSKLEAQLNDVKDALDRMAKGVYGLCEKCGKPIKTARLEANPSARNCIEHSS
ncbi:MAG: TraR/DksA C4-type zinc finger protein [Patescibacteria group bacterium]|nr:TraR/DksA C4-type zinc finger protein [Patescibacteria group bacterium]